MGRISFFITAAAPLALVWSSAAFAQDTQPRTAPDGTAGDEEIIVTARKRQELILNVPVVETVLSPETLERPKSSTFTALRRRCRACSSAATC